MNIVDKFSDIKSSETDFVKVSLIIENSRTKSKNFYFNADSFLIFGSYHGAVWVSDKINANTIFIKHYSSYMLIDDHLKCYLFIDYNHHSTLKKLYLAVHDKCQNQVELVEEIFYCPKCDKEILEKEIVHA